MSSISLYVFKCSESDTQYNITEWEAVREGFVTTVYQTPTDYNWRSYEQSLNCAQPLHLGYQMNYISLNVYKKFQPLMNSVTVFPVVIWLYIIISFIWVVITDRIIYRYVVKSFDKNRSIFQNVWIYAKVSYH